MEKERLDKYLVSHGYAPTRSKAQQLIKEGFVSVSGKVQTKTGHMVDGENICVSEHSDVLKYVGRGALKLEYALDYWDIISEGMTCLDVGASTGGFTDVLLQREAAFVVALDVGQNQLHPSLREHSKLLSMEGMDIRNFSLEEPFQEGFDLIVSDVSFISLTKIMDCIANLAKDRADIVLLIKPQFELEQRKNMKHGIVKDEKERKEAVERVLLSAQNVGFQKVGLVESPVVGGSGNIEYLAYFKKGQRE